jgi:hypothetical protein
MVKHYRFMGLRFFFKGLLRRHPARRSFRVAAAMRSRNIPTPRILGLVERGCAGLVAESWLISEDLRDAVELDRYLLRKFPGGGDFRMRRRFVRAFAPALRALLNQGFRHRDLKTCNILVLERGADWEFAFIDLDDVGILPSGAAVRRQDWILALGQLNPSTPKLLPWTDRLRFLREIPELERFDRRQLIAEVQQLSRRRGRVYFSDAGPVEKEFR